MKLLAIAILSFLNSCLVFSVMVAGMHGHIMFRLHMTEDWLGWGLVLLLFLFGCWSLIMFLKKISFRKNGYQ